MSDASDPPVPETTVGTSRLEAFSDGVMAVIITITALSLKAPLSGSFSALSWRLPELLVYILSFTFVGIYWKTTTTSARDVRHQRWRHVGQSPSALLALAHPGRDGVGGQLLQRPLARCDLRHRGPRCGNRLLHPGVCDHSGQWPGFFGWSRIGSNLKGNASMALYACGIGLAFLSPYLAYAVYALVAVIWFIPDRRLERPGFTPSED